MTGVRVSVQGVERHDDEETTLLTGMAEPAREVRRGEIYWLAPDPARGSVPSVAHPHVIVQDDVFNRSRVETVIVCALTSNPRRSEEPGNVWLDDGEGDLPKRSVAVVSQISSVQKTALGAYVGKLSEERVDQIVAGLRFQQRTFFDR